MTGIYKDCFNNYRLSKMVLGFIYLQILFYKCFSQVNLIPSGDFEYYSGNFSTVGVYSYSFVNYTNDSTWFNINLGVI